MLPSKDELEKYLLEIVRYNYYTSRVLDINYYWQASINKYSQYKDISQVNKLLARLDGHSIEYINLYRKIRNSLIHPTFQKVYYDLDGNVKLSQKDLLKLLKMLEKLREV